MLRSHRSEGRTSDDMSTSTDIEVGPVAPGGCAWLSCLASSARRLRTPCRSMLGVTVMSLHAGDV